jgi:ribonucleoside-diphosphate reductase alpha chain
MVDEIGENKGLEYQAQSASVQPVPSERRIYTYEEAFAASKEYFKLDNLAADTWISKYALKDASTVKDENDLASVVLYEKSPVDMHNRLASEFARIETKFGKGLTHGQLFDLMDHFKYIVPQGGPMSGIGNDLQIVSLSNCFVIGNKEKSADSYGAIMKIDQEQVQLMKRRGGVGHDLSYIRPKGMPVKNSALTSTGIVPFMERYSNSTREVAQDGRRGALMLSVSINHPDSEKFIDAKLESGKVTGANISVKLTDDFMKAVESKSKFIQRFPVNSDTPKYSKEIDAKTLWDKIIHNAWKSAEPGVLFWDTIIRESVPDCYADLDFNTVSTNPCGEIPLCPYDSCRLLAVNLFSYVKNPFTKDAEFDFDLYKEHIDSAQRMADDQIEMELEKIDTILEKIRNDPEDDETKTVEMNLWKRIRNTAAMGRRTGTGITGEGDMLAAMNLRYGTKEATEFATKVHKTFAIEAYRSSVKLAKERGAFEIYDAEREKDNPFIQRIKEADSKLYEDMVKYGRRNIALLTIAPTGTTSMMTQTTSGIEPVFSPVYDRQKKINQNDTNARVDKIDEKGDKWQIFKVFHHKFEDWLRVNNYNVEDVKKIADESLVNSEKENELEYILMKSPYYKATANDVNWLEKVKMQGEIQKWVDHSISVTVNLPADVKEDLVSELYLTAWKSGCKGATIYRDGSRDGIMKAPKMEKIVLVQKNVKAHPLLQIKPQALKYKVKRVANKDSLHIILTSDLYVDDTNKKAYFIPDEDFQVRSPGGAATSVTFAHSGMDRTEILRGSNPNYAEFVERLQSPFSNEDEGIGPSRIKSIEYAAGLVFEDYLLRNGILERDEATGTLVQTVKKGDLRKVERKSKEFQNIISQVNLAEGEEIEINGNNGKLDKVFECNRCGSTEFYFESGCHSPKCKSCDHDNGVGCG